MCFHNLISALTLWALIIACGACFSGCVSLDAHGSLGALAANPEFLNAAAGLGVVLYGIFKSSDWFRSRAGLKERAYMGLAEIVVARVWHNFLRGRLDSIEAGAKTGSVATSVPSNLLTNPNNAKAIAHSHAVDMFIEEAKKLPILSTHPAIVAAKKGDTKLIDAAIVTAVKRFKAGTAGIHTGPTTKGA